jgi:hypothetical protein
MGPDDFQFVDQEDFEKAQRAMPPEQITHLDQPIQRLSALLQAHNNDESKYQELLAEYPWVFGAQHRTIQRHLHLDDRNIPDFTASRVHDNNRDIIELKPPFMKIFREDGEFASDFNDAWNQAERYLTFTQRNPDYLFREKGMRFDSPRCYLIVGFGLSDEEIRRVRDKERLIPAIQVLTYDDLRTFMTHTVAFLRRLKSGDEPGNR